jgi:hypothetical protein
MPSWVPELTLSLSLCLSLCGRVAQAYTSQYVVLVMISLLLGEDRVSTRARRSEVIAELKALPGTFAWAPHSPPLAWQPPHTHAGPPQAPLLGSPLS